MSHIQATSRHTADFPRTMPMSNVQSMLDLYAIIAQLQEENIILRQQNKLMQQISVEQDEFLLAVTHDLKNPLSTILLGTSFLQQRWRDLSLHDIFSKLRKMQESALNMRDMINRLLAKSAAEAGKFDPHFEPVEIVNAVASVVHEYRGRAAEKGIIIHFCTCVPDTHITLDKGFLREIMENLLSNAVKYSPYSTTIRVQITGRTHSAYREHFFDNAPIDDDIMPNTSCNFICIEVSDEGPGIPEEEQPHLFKKFVRLSAKPTGGEDSTGLGLSITKKLVEILNGHIWYERRPEQGATFLVEFPCTLPAA